MNDLYEAGVTDDIFGLVYEANRENFVSVNTPNGLSKSKECLEEGKHLYYYKDIVPVPPLGLVDDLFTISTCGYKTTKMNQYINSKTAMKRLQF